MVKQAFIQKKSITFAGKIDWRANFDIIFSVLGKKEKYENITYIKEIGIDILTK